MNKFIFKSPRRLVKNSSNTPDAVLGQLLIVQNQCRFLRQDLVDVKLMLNKLLIDKHLQMQVDEYFTETSPQTDTEDNSRFNTKEPQ